MDFLTLRRAHATEARSRLAERSPRAAQGDVHLRHLQAVIERRDTASFIALFDYFAPRIKAYMKKLGAGDEDAEELAQNAMFTVWRKAASYDAARSAVSSWIFTIARNQRIDALRSDRRRVLDADDPLLVPPAPPAADEEVEAHEQQVRVRAAILALSAEQAAVIDLAFYQGMTHGEIAASLAIPLGTVKSRLRLAFQRIRAALETREANDAAAAQPVREAA